MHRFLVKGAWRSGDEVALPPEEARHAMRVLRLRDGDEVEILTGERVFFGRLRTSEGEKASVLLGAEEDPRTPPLRLTVYQGLTKSDKLDWIVQKLTELGAYACQPVAMARCVARAEGGEAQKKRERLSRIAEEAAKQCGCARAMRVFAPISYAEALSMLSAHELKLMPWEDARGVSPRLKEVFAAHPAASDVAVLIGPEGGIEAEEAARAEACGARFVSLGPRILRTETAAIASAAIAMSLWGDV